MNSEEMDVDLDNITQDRSLIDIENMLHLAKINANDLLPTSQTIYFTEKNLYDNNYKLLQLDPHLLQTLNEGDTVYIKGDPDENVVICTESKTYDVTETETSNSLLLVNNLKFKDILEKQHDAQRSISRVRVCGIFHDYLEAVLSKPHLQKLYNLLDKNLYNGPEREDEVDQTSLLTYEDLLNTIQASKQELDTALKAMHVVKINNKIRKLSLEYHFRILSFMLNLIEENSWGLDEIDYEETLNALTDLAPKEIINSLFDLYAEESKIIDGLQLYQYKEIDICKFIAQILLSTENKLYLNGFMQIWKDSVPEGMVPEEEMLYGISIINKVSTPHSIRAFNEEDLPENIVERFKVLFDTKEKWTVSEIAPYIQRVATEKTDVSALLAKYTRASTTNGVKYYSSKHAK